MFKDEQEDGFQLDLQGQPCMGLSLASFSAPIGLRLALVSFLASASLLYSLMKTLTSFVQILYKFGTS